MQKLDNSSSDSFQDMLDQQILESGRLFLWGEINSDLALAFIKQIRYLANAGFTAVVVYIHSDGGHVDAANTIIDEMEHHINNGMEIWTVVHGNAYSAGAFILCYGTRRFATNKSSMMIHPTAFELDYDYNDIHKNLVTFYDKSNERLLLAIAKRCGIKSKKKLEKFLQEAKDGIWLFSEEAIKYGLIENIWSNDLEKSFDDATKD